MRYLLLLLISFPIYAEYEFEKSKYDEGIVCEEMIGVWYTDISVNTKKNGRVRYLTKLERNADGTAKLKGLSIYVDQNDVNNWSFPSTWSCDGDWYTEKNEWGYTSFKIISLSPDIKLKDEQDNLGAGKIEFTELKSLNYPNSRIQKYFE